MRLIRVLPGLGLGIAILVLGPLRNHYRFEYQAAGLLGLALLSAIWLAIASLRGGRVAASPLDVPLFALVIAFTIASAVSLDPRRSLGQVQLLLAHVLLFWFLFDTLAPRPPQASSPNGVAPRSVDLEAGSWKLAAWVLGLLAVTGAVLLLAVAEVESWYLSWWNLGGAAHPWPPFGYRLTSWLGHSSGFSALIAACAPLAVVALLCSRRAPIRISLGLWIVGALVGLVFASSRAGWLALGAGLGSTLVLRALFGRRGTPAEGTQRSAGQESDTKSKKSTPPRNASRAAKWVLAGISMVALIAVGGVVLRTFRDPTHAPILLSRAELWPPAWQAFLSSPWTGTGPATFFRHYLAANPPSQHTFLTQAHSVPFSLLAEEGLIGLAAAGLVLLAGLLAAVRSLRASTPEDQPWRLGSLGGLAALGVHALTDNAATTIPVSLVLVVLAALALSGRAGPMRTRPMRGAWVVLLLLIGYGALTLPGQRAFERGLELMSGGNAGDAALAFDGAEGNDPRFAWYALQAGFAHGSATDGDPSQLAAAIGAFETGIRNEPAYSVHPLNLAWLYWQAGDHAQALKWMSQAAQADPSPLVLLNQGWMLESDGQLDAARRRYHASLDADARQADAGYGTLHGSIADLGHSLFWETNPFRRETLEAWAPRAQSSAYTRAVGEAYRRLAARDFHAASEGFGSALAIDPFRPDAFRGLGLTAWRSEEMDEARYYLQVAGSARGSGFGRMLAWLDLMELESEVGRGPQALRAGLRGFEILETYNSWGLGSDHANPYAWGVFYRESLPDDLLPWVLRPDMSADLANRLLDLARLLDLGGNRPDACRVTQRVLHAAPEFDPALAASEIYACGS
ncbi:MAG: O-antigen ligase family protein [Anaerolineales bacterium]